MCLLFILFSLFCPKAVQRTSSHSNTLCCLCFFRSNPSRQRYLDRLRLRFDVHFVTILTQISFVIQHTCNNYKHITTVVAFDIQLDR